MFQDYCSIDWAYAYRPNAADDDILFFPATLEVALEPNTRLL